MRDLLSSAIIKSIRAFLLIFILIHINTYAQNETNIELSWLGDIKPNISTGVSWGVPFNEGEIKSIDQLELVDNTGNLLPLQPWKLAYWYRWLI
ncbi:hypothetical protein [Thalassobellus suaedae]|uniref:PcRGLX/YetA-like N-terminal RIFT barrel domain-containing protein n=1 Tax=Thalassobellus suaedae TaxID=3074124 RepID=A0ABY9XY33_9FLAO|nr:hypothetical protein RHP51_08750 [Flavobacteriaceae bacterium HL-DH14]